jgi:CRP/FNR family nitrogen fixation transcriptional regulator
MGLAACDLYFAHQLWAVTAQDHRRIQNYIAVLGCMKARQRVAAFLLLMVQRSPGDDEIELSMTRQDIADYLGLTIETVSRMITQFEKEAVIGIASARRIVLRDRAALTVAVHDNSRASQGDWAAAACATKISNSDRLTQAASQTEWR